MDCFSDCFLTFMINLLVFEETKRPQKCQKSLFMEKMMWFQLIFEDFCQKKKKVSYTC